MTIYKDARNGRITEEMKKIAEVEGVDPEFVRRGLAAGRIVLLRNLKRADRVKTVAVGEGMLTKVNANIGTSNTLIDVNMEVEKAKIAKKYGADTVMDLSTGGNLDVIRRKIMEAAEPLPLGTVPIYQAFMDVATRKGAGLYMTEDDILNTIEKHLKDGVDFMTLHAALTRDLAAKAVKSDRAEPIVSRGGSILAAWMLEHGKENPLLSNFDYILEMFKEYDAVISLGDSLRPGALEDAHDEYHLSELMVNARLVKRAREAGVQVMLEGPGHVPLDRVVADVKLAKRLTEGAPYYILGPLVTDIAAGYDHIAGAIGGAIAAAHGADFLCYVTPAEHLNLPNPEQVREGVIAFRIAAHAADIVKYPDRAMKVDIEMGRCRGRLDWECMIRLSLDPDKAREIRNQYGPTSIKSCNMCGSLCVFLLLDKWRRKKDEELHAPLA
ncbi:phosphomethylpyrimidine synthase ThiC [Ignicoccus hospitalis]|uniref:Phosphomethylpyrimidine synthase n=1 Tax=Ignicoccus hospitalis (strain KIN4/I / DSM 18386 / JCM 14125) TaxID=453591 RepID=THIC_IGNH4|nr:phosphomethylpyrimidine synthase ThiC [Ignicoccus hospitalis]A8A8N6.1 RecName: Full=Phosphomethylpyrimidine synthase; AltName: Full=Hydroxymethylpyrimidine phosphate synthase; Short=HMP-P synthase; Short=HMP-phosphate synthase; Short=HMPP synthase; AltName: Full=Thiamine biosynthesis protein ThiC [Ignicoccus hospitalis KIN4/I]ABU81288.1 thiamine biosynthesis protein ThiC [Ignicoccus hospitalis KIN4/I]HIH90408.1 phosphomethylpyrimidine synthase ThiC [Desulfurococcaceae archaeon]